MTKQRKPPAGIQGRTADELLRDILQASQEIERLHAAYEEAVDALTQSYVERSAPASQRLLADDATLKTLMRQEKTDLFADTDVVNLPHGSLIHATVDKVHIPKTALSACEELGFAEVIKIAKSLDREAVEKWSDEKLVLIGAERKPKEEFSYDLKVLHAANDRPA